LKAKNSFSEIEETLLERDSLYRQAMDFCVETDDRCIDEICDEIVQQLKELESTLRIKP
jgi:shikimate kinase